MKPEEIERGADNAFLSNVSPNATTARLAEVVPLEEKDDPILSGAYPETPATELGGEVKVNPLPAADGAVNPIKLAPGEKIPEYMTAQGTASHVKLDKESYEKSDEIPGFPDTTSLPPVNNNMIPESSLPIAGPSDIFINSVSPQSTTAQLASAVPLESKVPERIKESQSKAHADPEMSANAGVVQEKAQVEKGSLEKVPTVPTTSEKIASTGTEKSESDGKLAERGAAAGQGAAEAVGVAGATLTSAVAGTADKLPGSVQAVLPGGDEQGAGLQQKENKLQTISPGVPAEVKDSITEAGQSPGAAANTAAVEDKKQMEAQLLQETQLTEAAGEMSVTTAGVSSETNGGSMPTAPETPSKAVATSTSSSPQSSTAGVSPASADRRKKNRISSLFSKFKPKTGKDKA